MSAHVTHLLSAYVEGQLSPRISKRVLRHTVECALCRRALAEHDQVHTDLDRTLSAYLSPRNTTQTQWWQTIQSMPVRIQRWRMSIALPLLMALILIVMPLIGAERLSLFSMTGLESTRPQPEVDITLNPPTTVGQFEDTRVQTESTPASDPSASHLESHPTLAQVEVPLIATPPSD